MGLKVIWSKRARKNFLNILEYIHETFGENTAKNYNDRIEHLISLLKDFPELGAIQHQEKNLRGIILYRKTTIFYTFNQERLLIVNIIDNRNKK